MSLFMVGDRVRYVGGGRIRTGSLVGKEGVVIAAGAWPSVDFGEAGTRSGLLTDNLELLPVAPQQAGPVRTVTRREIVPGDYDAVWIGREEYAGKVRLELRRTNLSASELRDAARIFNEIADVLEEHS